MLNNKETEHLIDSSYKIRLSVLKSLTRSGIGYLGACLAMTDIFTALYFNIIRNEADPIINDEVILLANYLEPLWLSSLAHAGLIPLKKMYADFPMPSVQHQTLSKLQHSLKFTNSYNPQNIKAKVFVIIGIEELLQPENLSLFSSGNFKISGNLILILDQSRLFIKQDQVTANKIRAIQTELIALGWDSMECDGHNFNDIISTISRDEPDPGQPLFILPYTFSGKGITTIEGKEEWYNKAPSSNEVREFCCQLEESFRINKMRLKP